jgi:hypothetical protein
VPAIAFGSVGDLDCTGGHPSVLPRDPTTFWVEYKLWGPRPFGYHLDNVLLHVLNALLVVAVLRRLGAPGAWLAGLLFALHPVHVESVAWVSERKNVLSAALYLGAALAYMRFSPPERNDERGSYRSYLLFVLLFVGALLGKTVTATLPVALLLVGYWKRGRLGWHDVRPLIVPCALAATAGLMTVWMEMHHVGAVGDSWDLGPAERLLVAGRALWFYLGTLVWPVGLTFIYPRWEVDSTVIWQLLYPVTAVAACAALYAARERIGRAPLTAALFFAGTLVPALGFFNVYPFRFSYVADHFQYLASLGPLAMAAAFFASLAGRRPWIGRALITAVVAFLALLTCHRERAFVDAETLWRDTLARNPKAWMAHLNLGALLDRSGRVEEAYTHYALAAQSRADLAGAWNNLGVAAGRLGRREEATLTPR